MIDIHTHILPGIDDGSESTEMSLKMIEEASSSGVHSMITTPHFYKGLYENYAGESLQKRWDSLHHAVHRAKLPVHLYQGMEIMACDDLPDLLRDGKVWTMNASSYFLLEFAFDEEPAYCQKIIDACMSSGYTPVIAHPARYYFIQDNPAIVYEWFRQGCGIQLNKGTLLGENGIRARNTAFSLLRHKVVSCVASDAHRTYWRNADMQSTEDLLLEHFGPDYTYLLTEENPDRILRNMELVGYEPVPYEKKRIKM